MARKLRVFFDGIAQHILIQGLAGKSIYKDEADYTFYLDTINALLLKINKIDLHAYSLNKKSVSFLLSSDSQESISRFIQSLNLKYVSYYNKKYNRRGTLWQGRYKSSLVQDRYILPCMCYIETLKKEQKFTSCFHNIFLYQNKIISEHDIYVLLGKDAADRAAIYSKFLQRASLKEDNIFIQECIEKQLPTGDALFYEELEALSGESFQLKKRGRPKKKSNKRKKMYSKLSVLSKEEHKSLKISPLQDLNFAKELKFIPIVTNEAQQVAEVFPVVFTSDEIPSLVALTSLGGDNLAINQDGKYITRYVPAYLRKYPFALANKKESTEKIVLINSEAPCVSKTKGKQLFTKSGEQSEILKNTINFLSEYEKQLQNTLAVIKIIKDSGILENREISLGEGEDKKVLVNGFQVVSKEKLNDLDDEMLAQWVRKGIISFIDTHINSLSKIEVLFKLASQKTQEQN